MDTVDATKRMDEKKRLGVRVTTLCSVSVRLTHNSQPPPQGGGSSGQAVGVALCGVSPSHKSRALLLSCSLIHAILRHLPFSEHQKIHCILSLPSADQRFSQLKSYCKLCMLSHRSVLSTVEVDVLVVLVLQR